MRTYSSLEDFVAAFWVFAVIMSFILNFNLFGVLIIYGWDKGWDWMLKNWLCDIGIVLMPLIYISTHYILIFGFKTGIDKFKN